MAAPNSRTRRFDAIIIGAGQAGPSLAGRLTAAGWTVALVERQDVGGTCVNTGCMPTKTLVASAYAAHLARRSADYGVVLQGEVGVDMKQVHDRARTVTLNARGNLEKWLGGMKGCTVFRGHARFEDADAVRVGDNLLTAPKIFLNVGGRANAPDMPGLDQISYLTNVGMMDVATLPEHLVIVGGSYIGLEFAQMYRRFGAEVTVVEMGPRLIGREDPEISDAVRQILEAEGVNIRLNAECISFSPRDEGVCVHVTCQDGAPQVVGSHVLLAIGRRPNTDDLGLDKAGVALDKRGYVVVDDQLKTSNPGVWALGDCNGKGAFTHTAYNDFEIVAANLLDGDPRRVSDRIACYGLFIDPPLGRVGLTEAEARATGRPLLVGGRPMSRVGRAVEKGETQGFMKVVVDAGTKQILGAAILGLNGDEAVHGLIDLMYARAPYTVIQRAVHIHPTVSELIPTMLGELKPLD
ncbi:FAD-containing oxidoreductase [Caulobacter sp. BK020]|uniref:FAD-containing oxidoreductase n=1 Tax=Caulobacter sp. BK020 TaxID=2512117 RepID=UPI0010539F07|nr:FAD-containing oxidoreductase [Caulobacter sp. BK020]TCS10510.1 pyruvate/2-oxoglutarate dehydrogenase complex dihydrolipoamide dehydrogenase (E3) component [Caulobacter sp. BK020]